MKIAYFDCFSGVSGDMTLGALVDAGLALEDLKKSLSGLSIKGFALKARTVHKADLKATKVDVLIDSTPSSAPGRLRTLPDLERVIRSSRLGESLRQKGLKVLKRLIQAEAKSHGVPANRLKLHGMDPVDTLVDIMGTVVGLHLLGIQRVLCSPIHVGSGLKGLRPATVELLKGAPIYASGTPHELATPTGAALMTSLAEEFSPVPSLILRGVGYGAGTLDISQGPNLLRVLIGESAATPQSYETDRVLELETNIDDLSPQIYEHLMEGLLAAGALDVYLTPILMKKGRPATKVSILCHSDHSDRILTILFQETTTLGVRIHEAVRAKLFRMNRTLSTRFGKVRVKLVLREATKWDATPEYEDCREIARRTGLPLRTVLDKIKQDIKSAAHKWKKES
jgi:uncharacterized protein (TIGR00299 family) protein